MLAQKTESVHEGESGAERELDGCSVFYQSGGLRDATFNNGGECQAESVVIVSSRLSALTHSVPLCC
jgi:hypothetical protein